MNFESLIQSYKINFNFNNPLKLNLIFKIDQKGLTYFFKENICKKIS